MMHGKAKIVPFKSSPGSSRRIGGIEQVLSIKINRLNQFGNPVPCGEPSLSLEGITLKCLSSVLQLVFSSIWKIARLSNNVFLLSQIGFMQINGPESAAEISSLEIRKTKP
jgi:hypothetical protein